MPAKTSRTPPPSVGKPQRLCCPLLCCVTFPCLLACRLHCLQLILLLLTTGSAYGSMRLRFIRPKWSRLLNWTPTRIIFSVPIHMAYSAHHCFWLFVPKPLASLDSFQVPNVRPPVVVLSCLCVIIVRANITVCGGCANNNWHDGRTERAFPHLAWALQGKLLLSCFQ